MFSNTRKIINLNKKPKSNVKGVEKKEEKEEIQEQEVSPTEKEEIKQCIGPNSASIRIIGMENHVIYIKREHAMLSRTIRCMLSGPGVAAEDEVNVIYLKEIPGQILDIICSFLEMRYKCMTEGTPIRPVDVTPGNVVDLLMACNFLDC